jgi:hypothetical protein
MTAVICNSEAEARHVARQLGWDADGTNWALCPDHKRTKGES